MGRILYASDRRRSKWRNSDSNPTLQPRTGLALLCHVGSPLPQNIVRFPETFRYREGERVYFKRNRHIDLRLHTGTVLSRWRDFGTDARYRVRSDLDGVVYEVSHSGFVTSLSIVLAA